MTTMSTPYSRISPASAVSCRPGPDRIAVSISAATRRRPVPSSLTDAGPAPRTGAPCAASRCVGGDTALARDEARDPRQRREVRFGDLVVGWLNPEPLFEKVHQLHHAHRVHDPALHQVLVFGYHPIGPRVEKVVRDVPPRFVDDLRFRHVPTSQVVMAGARTPQQHRSLREIRPAGAALLGGQPTKPERMCRTIVASRVS